MTIYRISYFLILLFIFSCDNKLIYSDVTLETDSYNYSNYSIKFSLDREAEAYIFYWPVDSIDHKFRSIVSKPKKDHQINLTLLEPSLNYNFIIHSTYKNSNYNSQLFSFTSRELPYKFPSFEIKKNNNYNFNGYIFLRTQTNPGIQLLINSNGVPLWYGMADTTLSRPFNTINSQSYLSLSSKSLIEEITFTGDTVTSINTDKNVVHHDILKHQNRYIGLSYKYFELKGNSKFSSLKGDGIVVYNADGKLLWEWNIFDFVDPIDEDNGYKIQEDWSHANGISIDSDGNFLISFRSFNQIWKINSLTGQIVWKLGINGDFDLSENEIFYQQHAIHKIDDDTYMLFDNGDAELRKSSRALIFKLDEKNNDFQIEKSVFLPDDLFSFKQGSVYLFDQDKLLFASSVNSRVVITNMNGEVLWNLNSDYSFYRAYYLNKML